MPDPVPVILQSPDLSISDMDPTTPTFATLKCLMSHIEMTPDVSVIEVKTSCGVKEYPGTIKWSLKATLYHSFDPVGTNAILTAAVEGGVPVDFKVLPNANAPVSDTNPEYFGQVIPQPFAPLSGDVGDASSFDLEWSIVGWTNVPTMSTTPTTLAAPTTAPVEEPTPA